MISDAVQETSPDFDVTPGLEGLSLQLEEEMTFRVG